MLMQEKQGGIRTSLTFSIAVHYCIQIIKTAIPAVLLVSLLLSVYKISLLRATENRLSAAIVPDEGVYSQEIIRNEMISARVSEIDMPEGTWNQGLFFLQNWFHGFPGYACRTIPIRDHPEKCVELVINLRGWWRMLLYAAAGFVLSDLIRMVYLLRHNDRLYKPVVKPIREMTAMAAEVSANNLSNRIEVGEIKNELRELALVINGMLDRIEISYNSQKQFVSDASHELRTPIAVIQGYADMLNRWGKDDPQVLNEGLTAISQETRSMKDLVQDLLFLARHDKKTLMMEMSQFNMQELLEEILREESMVHAEHVFEIRESDECTIEADRNMIKQVIRILTDNAVRYSDKGGQIILQCKKTEEFCEISVEDHGSGISADDMPRIFERFYRSDNARKVESSGHGLGLSIARIIVIAHGGKIHVRSKVGEGSTFYILLPYSQPVSGQAPVEIEEEIDHPGRRILKRPARDGKKTA